MKKYQIWIYAAVGIVVVAIVVYLNGYIQKDSVQKNTETEKLPIKSPVPSPSQEKKFGEIRGMLKESDNIERGNLMLMVSDRSVYLNTLRDFQALVGKRVVVKIDGTLESFRLIDIIAAP